MEFRRELKKEFALEVRLARVSRNMSQKQVDKLCGWRAPTTSGVERERLA